MKPHLTASLLTVLALGGGASEMPAHAGTPVASTDVTAIDREHYLIEINCDPGDRQAITGSLRTALALREDGSTVTIFIESTAVFIVDPSLEVQPADALAEIKRLFDKVRTAGVAILVCPHCTSMYSIDEKSLRPGLRLTDKEELASERARAHKIYQFRSTKVPASAAKPVDGCQPG